MWIAIFLFCITNCISSAGYLRFFKIDTNVRYVILTGATTLLTLILPIMFPQYAGYVLLFFLAYNAIGYVIC